MGGPTVTQQDGMEHEVEDPRPKQDHRHHDRVTIVHKPDVDGPVRRLRDRDLGALGPDKEDDLPGGALIWPNLKTEGHHCPPGGQLGEGEIAGGPEFEVREARRHSPPDLIDTSRRIRQRNWTPRWR